MLLVPFVVGVFVFTFFPSGINASYIRAKELIEGTVVEDTIASIQREYTKHFTSITITQIDGNSLTLQGNAVWEAQNEIDEQIHIRKIEGVVTLVAGASSENKDDCSVELTVEKDTVKGKDQNSCKEMDMNFDGTKREAE
jgi:hypothetical protein